MSFVRMLAHADIYTVEGLVATTSWWLNDTTAPEAMLDIIDKYEIVRANLQTHTDGDFPTASYLRNQVTTGPKVFGTYALDALENGEALSDGAQLLIDVVGASDEKLYIQAWGSVNKLAQALWSVRKTRSVADVATFVSKLSLYTISDQDNAAFWIRHTFPELRYLASIHGLNQYGDSAWLGISSIGYYVGGPNATVVSQA
ncbi:hypothetical protein LTR17_021966 [Elasticomyces elasticus]|nr:hypothetical protein LTR17_021966 [Elasticomyces elasticus]